MSPLLWTFSWLMAAASGGTANNAPTATAPSLDPAQGANIDALVARLNHPADRERQAATEALLTRGRDAYDALRRAYRASDSYDLRRRIRRLTLQVFIDERMGRPPAFLGVQLGDPDYQKEKRIPDGAAGLVIVDVIPGTAADAAGLRPRDLIVRLDGQTVSRNYDGGGSPISRKIAEHRAGDSVEFQFYRGEDLKTRVVQLRRRPWHLSFGQAVNPGAPAGWWFGRNSRAGDFARTLHEFDAWWRESFDAGPGAEVSQPGAQDRRWRLRAFRGR